MKCNHFNFAFQRLKENCDLASGNYEFFIKSHVYPLFIEIGFRRVFLSLYLKGNYTDTLCMHENKVRKMNCLAAVAADIRPTIETFKAANLLKLDSCALDRGKKILKKTGIENYKYSRMTDLGCMKGQSTELMRLLTRLMKKLKAYT